MSRKVSQPARKRRKKGHREPRPVRGTTLRPKIILGLRESHANDLKERGEHDRNYYTLWKTNSMNELYFSAAIGVDITFDFDFETNQEIANKIFLEEYAKNINYNIKKLYRFNTEELMNRISDKYIDEHLLHYIAGKDIITKSDRVKELYSVVFNIDSELELRNIETQNMKEDPQLLDRGVWIHLCGVLVPFDVIDIITEYMEKDLGYLNGFGVASKDCYKAALLGWNRPLKVTSKNYNKVPRMVLLFAKVMMVYPQKPFTNEQIRSGLFENSVMELGRYLEVKKMSIIGDVNSYASAVRKKNKYPPLKFPYIQKLKMVDHEDSFATKADTVRKAVRKNVLKKCPMIDTFEDPNVKAFFRIRENSEDTIQRMNRVARILDVKQYPKVDKLTIPATYFIYQGIGVDRIDLLYRLKVLVVMHERKNDNLRGSRNVFVTDKSGQKKITISDKPNDFVWKLRNLRQLSLRCSFFERDLGGIASMKNLTDLTIRLFFEKPTIKELLKRLAGLENLRRFFFFIDSVVVFDQFDPTLIKELKLLEELKLRFEIGRLMLDKCKNLIACAETMKRMRSVWMDGFQTWDTPRELIPQAFLTLKHLFFLSDPSNATDFSLSVTRANQEYFYRDVMMKLSNVKLVVYENEEQWQRYRMEEFNKALEAVKKNAEQVRFYQCGNVSEEDGRVMRVILSRSRESGNHPREGNFYHGFGKYRERGDVCE